MTKDKKKSSIWDLMRPVAMLVVSFIAALFVFLIVLMTMRPSTPETWRTALIALGGTFIVSLMTISMLLMAIKPDDFEQEQIRGLDELGDLKAKAQAEAAAEATETAEADDQSK